MKPYILLPCILAVAAPSMAGTLGVCPQGSEGDHPFREGDLAQCMWVVNDHNRLPQPFQEVDYNIYCPGRLPAAVANRIGEQIVAGTPIRDQGQRVMNPVEEQHRRARLAPVFSSVPHRFEYDCWLSGQPAVATHIKLRVRALPLEEGPRNCRFFGSQNGDIALNARMDRVYKCDPPFHSSQREDILWDEAERLVERDFLGDLARVVGKACILGGGNHATDIQCSPCTFSDKLIVRLTTVPLTADCPRNTVRTVSGSDSSDSANTCFSSVQDRIAWDYEGSTSWARANVERLCRGAEGSAEPARCFNRVVHGGVNWGAGTRWRWQNALDLCEGTGDSSSTVACFQSQIAGGSNWPDAIRICGG